MVGQESLIKDDSTFYDFVPYKYGPFSFSLYKEINALEKKGYVSCTEKSIRANSAISKEIQDKRTEQWFVCCLIITPLICVLLIIFGQWLNQVKQTKTKVSKVEVLQRSTKVEFVNSKKVRQMLSQVIVLNKN